MDHLRKELQDNIFTDTSMIMITDHEQDKVALRERTKGAMSDIV